MRSKLLIAIACFVSLSVAFSSCLGDDNEETEYSISTAVTAFGLDSVNGKHYTFSIDQLNHVIFNADSMPVGADTILNSILIDTFSSSGYITSGLADSIVNISNEVDLTPAINSKVGMEFKIYSQDLSTTQVYALHINVHKQHPDSMSWKQIEMPEEFASSTLGNSQKTVTLGDSIIIYDASDASNSIRAYIADGSDPTSYTWNAAEVTGLPANADISSVLNGQDILYAIDTEGNVYYTSDGVDWAESAALSGDVTALVGSFSTHISAIRTMDGTAYHCTATSPESGWTNGDAVATGFPSDKFSYVSVVSGTGVEHLAVVGTSDNSKQTITWMSMDGLRWSDMSTTSDYYCPAMDNPSLLYCDGQYYIFGSGLDAVYVSTGGLVWNKTNTKFTLPEAISGNATYSMTVDNNKFVWIAISGSDGQGNSLWRGRLNKFGFLRQ